MLQLTNVGPMAPDHSSFAISILSLYSLAVEVLQEVRYEILIAIVGYQKFFLNLFQQMKHLTHTSGL